MGIRPSKIFRITLDTSNTINGMDLTEADFLMTLELDSFFSQEMREKGKVAVDGNEIAYIRDEGQLAKQFYGIVSKYHNSTIEDVSEQVIRDNSLLSDMDDYCREYSFQMFEEFRKDYSSVDDILDKIVENGMDSLDEIDKTILKEKSTD